MPRKQMQNLRRLMATFANPFRVATTGRRNMSSSRRFFFVDFFKNRDWDSVAKFWHNNVRSPSPLVTGNKKYGITDLKTLECNSNQQTNYSRFALRVGYCGTMYTSYPRNLGRDTEGQVRVENDIDAALGKEAYCSRMTNPNASAISQIVSVSGSSNDTAAAILEKARRCLPVGLGRLAIYDCVRVMDSFHAREQATWRRYLYLFPLNEGEHDGVDIDVDFVNDALKRLENVTLNYGPLSNDKNQNGVRSVIYRARAREIDMTPHDSQGFDNVKGLFVFGTPRELALGDENIIPHQTTTSALCVEIVGTHFLDKMVRIIVATAIGESVRYQNERNVNILLDICNSRDRDLYIDAVPRVGLCLAGIGYEGPDESTKALIESNTLTNQGLSWTVGYSTRPPLATDRFRK